MPGVLLIEALAQAARRLAIASFWKAADDRALYYFGGIDGVRFVRRLCRRAGVFKGRPLPP